MEKITINIGEQIKNDQAIKERVKKLFGLEVSNNSPIFYGTIVIEKDSGKKR